jgi:chemotaxis protein methyltransferase CheR
LADYYRVRYDYAKIDPVLQENILFAHHNLASDGVFCEMHLILCRNVLIYFNRCLQDRVLTLFRDSLARRGFVCLGAREELALSSVADQFEVLDRKRRLFRRLPVPEAAHG